MDKNVMYSEQEEPIVLSKALLDLLLKQERPADLIAIYTFYYYTAKWQKTNLPLSTTAYTAKALDWSVDRVRAAKNTLRELGLIEDIVRKDNGKITGHFIKVNFIWSRNHTTDFTEGGSGNHPTDISTPGKKHTVENSEENALSTINLNALSTNRENALSSGRCPTPKNESFHILGNEDMSQENIKNIIPPKYEWIKEYCQERKNNIDPLRFFDFYTCKGWMVGKNKMKDWQAAVRQWEQRDQSDINKSNPKFNNRSYNPNHKYRESDVTI